MEYGDFDEPTALENKDDIIEEFEDNAAEFFTIDEEIEGEEHLDDTDDSDNDVDRIVDNDDEFRPIPKKKIKKEIIMPHKIIKVQSLATNNAKQKTTSTAQYGQKKTGGRRRKGNELESETHICEVCGNIYSKRSLLNMHMRRHRSEKPFECE